MSAQATAPGLAGTSNNAQLTPSNAGASVKPAGSEGTEKVKPCCVCKDEKSARDECMLFSTAKDPQAACQDLVGAYRSCMRGYGFNIA